MGFEKRLRSAREKQGLTQKEFAEKLNTSAQNLAQYETGKRKPKKDTLNKFAKTLGLGYGYAPNGEAYFYCFVDTTNTDSNTDSEIFNKWQYNDAMGVTDGKIHIPAKKRPLSQKEIEEIESEEKELAFINKMDELGSQLNDEGQEKVIDYAEDLTRISAYQRTPDRSE